MVIEVELKMPKKYNLDESKLTLHFKVYMLYNIEIISVHIVISIFIKKFYRIFIFIVHDIIFYF